jgi:hypothetical protein
LLLGFTKTPGGRETGKPSSFSYEKRKFYYSSIAQFTHSDLNEWRDVWLVIQRSVPVKIGSTLVINGFGNELCSHQAATRELVRVEAICLENGATLNVVCATAAFWEW